MDTLMSVRERETKRERDRARSSRLLVCLPVQPVDLGLLVIVG
jgi:hypothetical protein